MENTAPNTSPLKHGINLNTTTDMRSFSDTEKRILRFMAYPPIPQDVCLISIFENFSDCYLIEWPEDCSSLELVHAQDKDWKDVRSKIFDIIVLLQYLESNQYIGVFQLNLLKDNQIFNRKKFEVEKDDKGNILMWIIDTCKLNIKIPNGKGIEGEYTRKLLVETSILKENTTAAEQIKRYANSSFHATQNLRDFVDNDFQTKEDLQYTQTRKQTWIAIWISLCVGIGGIIATILTLFIK